MRRGSRGIVGIFSCLLVAVLALAGCAKPADQPKGGDGGKKLTVFATTGYLADAVHNVAPDATVTTMVGPGGDPHTYEPSTKDIEALQKSDLVFWNGLHLEARMVDQLSSLGDKQLAVGEKVDKSKLLDWPEKDDKGNKLHDPHIWNSTEIWSEVVGEIGEKFAATDPDNAQKYRDNAKKYQAEIAKTSTEAKALLDKIPANSRVLISGHDAFNYFGRTMKLEVHATDFVSSEAKRSPQEISELADLIVKHKVPVIFVDNLANPQAITSLKEAVHAKGWNVKVSDKELYADSLGAEKGVDTYLGVYLHNAKAIAEALGK